MQLTPVQTKNFVPSQAASTDLTNTLKYDYEQIDEANRRTVQGAAVEIKAHAERAKTSMITIGQKLAKVKELLPHGQFETWCRVEFDMNERTAQRMMNAARVFGDKSDKLSLLSDSAMYMLSSDSVPEAAREEVIAIAQATGERPKVKEIQAVIDKHKPDDELRDKCHKLEFWLMGKGWSGFGRKNEEGKLISGVQKGDYRFVWLDDDWRDRYEKIKAAEKIERAAIEAAKHAPQSAPTPSVAAQVIEMAKEMDADIQRILQPTEPETEPIAVELQLPSISISDKSLFIEQTKRAVGVLNEEGCATVANFLRIAGRYALDAQSATQPQPEEPQADERSKDERVRGLASILETALALVVEDYGQLTGYFSHVPAAERTLREMIARLKENLTK